MTRKQKILSVLLGAILVLSVTMLTYGYFAIANNFTGNTGIVEVTTTELANLIMTSMKSEKGDPVYPGWVGYQGIEVHATGNGNAIYDLSLEITGGSNVKGEVQVAICKKENQTTSLASNEFTFTAATAQVNTSVTPPQYYMSGGTAALPSGCTEVVGTTLSTLGASKLISAQGGKVIEGGKYDKYYIIYNYQNNGDQNASQGENFTVTPVISARGGIQSAGTTLAEAIISKYGTDANLYYHTTDTTKYENGEGSITSTEQVNGTTETYANLNAGDGSYRYSGASASVYNYICFGTDNENTCLTDTSNNGTSKYLYRIIGVFEDGSGNYVTKIIMANDLYNSVTSDRVVSGNYIWNIDEDNSESEWSRASLKQWLNNETLNSGSESHYPTTKFLENYTSTWANKIVPSTWYVRGNDWENYYIINAKTWYTFEIANVKNGVSGYTTNCQGNSAVLTNTKVGLMYVSDYMYGASPTYWNYQNEYANGVRDGYSASTSSNWLFQSWEWTISPAADDCIAAWGVDNSGYVYLIDFVDVAEEVRPVMYLSSDVEIDTSATSADGSSSHPYMLSAE